MMALSILAIVSLVFNLVLSVVCYVNTKDIDLIDLRIASIHRDEKNIEDRIKKIEEHLNIGDDIRAWDCRLDRMAIDISDAFRRLYDYMGIELKVEPESVKLVKKEKSK